MHSSRGCRQKLSSNAVVSAAPITQKSGAQQHLRVEDRNTCQQHIQPSQGNGMCSTNDKAAKRSQFECSKSVLSCALLAGLRLKKKKAQDERQSITLQQKELPSNVAGVGGSHDKTSMAQSNNCAEKITASRAGLPKWECAPPAARPSTNRRRVHHDRDGIFRLDFCFLEDENGAPSPPTSLWKVINILRHVQVRT